MKIPTKTPDASHLNCATAENALREVKEVSKEYEKRDEKVEVELRYASQTPKPISTPIRVEMTLLKADWAKVRTNRKGLPFRQTCSCSCSSREGVVIKGGGDCCDDGA